MQRKTRSSRSQKRNVSRSRKAMRSKAVVLGCALLFVLALIAYLRDPEAFTQGLEAVAQTPAGSDGLQQTGIPSVETESSTFSPSTSAQPETEFDGALEIYVLDVGQGDSIFLRAPGGETMLIDAGEAQYFSEIDSFLKEQDVASLDVVVATHPHSDHIGGMSQIIEAYEIENFYMPAVTHTTATFEKMLSALEAREITPTIAYASSHAEIAWDEDVSVRILSPLEGINYEDLNDWSIVLNITYGETGILLAGDAEAYAEDAMLANFPAEDFAATVLKLGHHGSSTSTTEAFLSAVSPQIAIVSAGAGNSYGHPDEETLALLEAYGVTVCRTDEQGTIHIMLDGKAAEIEMEKAG